MKELKGKRVMTDGQAYRNRYVVRMKVDGGLVSSFRMYYNPIISARAFRRALGD